MLHSIVIPVHGEETNLRSFFDAFVTRLANFDDLRNFEILLVENGSLDQTWNRCQEIQLSYPDLVTALQLGFAGYGDAIKYGLTRSHGDFLSILEVDFLDVDFLRSACALFQEDPQLKLVVGSKRHPDSCDRRPLLRRFLTFGFNSILRLVFGYPGTDTHGLKSMAGKVGRQVSQQLITNGELTQTELVLLFWRFGHRIAEVPVELQENRSPSVSILRRVPKILCLIKNLRQSLSRYPRRQTRPPAAVLED